MSAQSTLHDSMPPIIPSKERLEEEGEAENAPPKDIHPGQTSKRACKSEAFLSFRV